MQRAAASVPAAHRSGGGGNAAELGCYRGDTSWQLNVLMPDRKLYLFDTFGDSMNGMLTWNEKLGCSRRSDGPVFHGTDKEKKLMERMPLPGQVVIRRSWFPEACL
ncbi:MAG: hypothetical protein ACLTBV_32910 [Enterocloster bolteae]